VDIYKVNQKLWKAKVQVFYHVLLKRFLMQLLLNLSGLRIYTEYT